MWRRIFLETPEQANVEEPVTLDFVKQQVQQRVIDDDDDYLFELIAMARQFAENYTRRCFVTRTATMILPAFPPWEILLPYGAAQSVTTIAYVDTSGTPQTLSGAASPAVFQVDLTSEDRAVIWPLRTGEWPTADSLSIAPVTVTWEAGYGSASSVPNQIRLGIARQVARWYEARTNLEEAPSVEPEFARLLTMYQIVREA